MRALYTVLLAIEWIVMVGALLAAIPLAFLVSANTGLLAALLGFSALACLKLEVVSFGIPGRK